MLPVAAQADDGPCAAQLVAVQAASAAAEPLDSAFDDTLQQMLALPLASEAPELAGFQLDVLTQLAQVQAAALVRGTGTTAVPNDASDTVAPWAQIDADLAQVQAGIVGPDGQPRSSVNAFTVLVQRAKDQAQAVAQVNEQLGEAVQAVGACTTAQFDDGSSTQPGIGDSGTSGGGNDGGGD
ncbi:MAG: hypothetical protein JO020_23635 [Chloroflexi bacterium]|nr:hypothetical protein [Chloroflexota bacterium]